MAEREKQELVRYGECIRRIAPIINEYADIKAMAPLIELCSRHTEEIHWLTTPLNELIREMEDHGEG